MIVAIGNDEAKDFSLLSRPFYVPPGRHALWNSLMIKDAGTVVALTTTNAYNASYDELWTIEGRIVREPDAPAADVQINGLPDEPVWQLADKVFVGAFTGRSIEAQAVHDSDALSVHLRVSEERDSGPSESILIAVAPRKVAENIPSRGAYRLRISANGDYVLDQGDNGIWKPVDDPALTVLSRKVASAAGQTVDWEISIPWSTVGEPEGGAVGFNVGMVSLDASQRLLTEWVAGTDPNRPATWMKLNLIP